MVAQKKCYQENNNHNFILRPSLPPPFPAREKSMSFTVSFCHGAVRGKAINRVLTIGPVLHQHAVRGPMASCIELMLICMGASFSFGDQCCVSDSGDCRVQQGSQGDHQPLTEPQVCLDGIYSLTLCFEYEMSPSLLY